MNSQVKGVDFADVQGIVRFAHGHLKGASYLLLTVKDPQSARAWLRDAPITDAVESLPLASSAMHVAFTASGLRAVGVPEAAVAQFSPEFLQGVGGEDDRSRRLGDVGANAPQYWTWGNVDREPHVLVALFAAPEALDAFVVRVRTPLWDRAFASIAELGTSDLYGFEQFGFTDGISQPQIDWQQQLELRGDKPAYGNVVALGEVLLGYRNEYDRYTDRPLLSTGGVNDLLLPAEDDASKRDLGRNGTYLVLRDLLQDVRAFWSFAKTETIASAFVGRTPKGESLVQTGNDQNDFTFAQDPDGTRCPFGAHIRRANPRNGDFSSVPSGPIATLLAMLGFGKQRFQDDITSSVRFHRIVRRGREYGLPLAPSDATLPAPADDPARGLRFVCLNANIGRQFEFLQSAWFASSKFNGLVGESDPLLGNREPGPNGESTDAFVMNRADAARTRLTGLPQFVTVTGGAYFFLPGLSALRYISQSA
ncbi:MAG: peroxidase [Candidatus Tumulicola sp.]